MTSNYLQLQNLAKKIIEGKEAHIREVILSDPTSVETTSEALVDRIVAEIILDLVGEFHRAIKLGYGEYFCAQFDGRNDNSSSNSNHAFEEEGKKSEDIKCPNCTRPISASRFAPHLEKCMRMGRNSSRIASRRIANNSKENSYGGMISDDDDDEDWSAISEKIKGSKKLEPRKKKDKPRKQKSLKSVKEESVDTDEGIALSKLLSMTSDDRVLFLSTTCAVKNEVTGKLCTRSVRCSQHNGEERLLIRKLLPTDPVAGEGYVDAEEVESSSKNETEHSSTSSPADSTSTTSSSSTKKKEKYKQKNVKVKITSELYNQE